MKKEYNKPELELISFEEEVMAPVSEENESTIQDPWKGVV